MRAMLMHMGGLTPAEERLWTGLRNGTLSASALSEADADVLRRMRRPLAANSNAGRRAASASAPAKPKPRAPVPHKPPTGPRAATSSDSEITKRVAELKRRTDVLETDNRSTKATVQGHENRLVMLQHRVQHLEGQTGREYKPDPREEPPPEARSSRGLPAAQKAELDRRMGLTSPRIGVVQRGNVLILGAPLPEGGGRPRAAVPKLRKPQASPTRTLPAAQKAELDRRMGLLGPSDAVEMKGNVLILGAPAPVSKVGA